MGRQYTPEIGASLAKRCQQVMDMFWNWSPFAFASTALEAQYQSYQASHVGSVAKGLCSVTLLCWASKGLWTGSQAWMLALPIAVCMAILTLMGLAPHTYKRFWQPCAFGYHVAHTLVGTQIHQLMIRTSRQEFYKMGQAQIFMMEHARATIFLCIAVGAPLNLPACLLAELIFFLTQDAASTWYCEAFPFAQRPVSGLYQHLMDAGTRGMTETTPCAEGVVACQVRMLFWQVQALILTAGSGLVRDVLWRRSFLASNPHLLGPNGAAKAARWPLGSMHTTTTCFITVAFLIMLDAVILDFAIFSLGTSMPGMLSS